MTAVSATPRPSLHLVASRGTRRPVPTGKREPLVALAVARAVDALGTVFVPSAAGLARALESRAPLLVARGRADLWAAAIVFLLAEEGRVFACGCGVTRTSLARELGSTVRTLRRRAEAVRTALAPLHLDLPEPDDG